MACATNDCYGSTNLAPSDLSVGQWLGLGLGLGWGWSGTCPGCSGLLRAAPGCSGLPKEGRLSQHPGDIDPAALEQAWSGVTANVWLVLVAVGLIVAAIGARRHPMRGHGHRMPGRGYWRLGTGLMVFGTILALLPTLLVSVSEGLQGGGERGWNVRY